SGTGGAVLRGVVGAEGGVLLLDRRPPPLVLLVPLHGLAEARVEGHLRLPAERAEPGGVERIPAIVSGPVLHALDERGVASRELEDAGGDIDVPDLVAAAAVVDLAVRALLDAHVDGPALVL